MALTDHEMVDIHYNKMASLQVTCSDHMRQMKVVVFILVHISSVVLYVVYIS